MDRMPHLMHVFPSFAPGGAELRVAKIINGIGPKLRHSILALSGDYGAAPYVRSDAAVTYLEPLPGRGGLFYFRQLRGLIRRQRPDLLLTYNWGTIDAVFAGLISWQCPVIHNECGFGADESAGLKTRRVLARRVLLNRIHATVVTSRTLQTICLEQFQVKPSKVRWIRTGVDPERFHPGLSRAWRRQLGIAEDQIVIGFLGALRPEKNVSLLVRAFAEARLPGAKLVLIGQGPCRESLEALVRELGLGDSVIFAGHQADPAVCLPALDLFAMSSDTEQTSNALLEAMACGLPAVVTDTGDSREVLGQGSGPVIVPTGNTSAYAEALRRLGTSPTERAALGTANRDRCVTTYSLSRMVAEYESLYLGAAAK